VKNRNEKITTAVGKEYIYFILLYIYIHNVRHMSSGPGSEGLPFSQLTIILKKLCIHTHTIMYIGQFQMFTCFLTDNNCAYTTLVHVPKSPPGSRLSGPETAWWIGLTDENVEGIYRWTATDEVAKYTCMYTAVSMTP